MKKLVRSFGYAFKGFGYAAKTQLNFRIHLAASVLAGFTGCLLHISAHDWLWIALCITAVLTAELFNTAIELLVDLVSPGYNEKAGRVKDISAAAVVVVAAFAVVTGLIIFLPKIITLFYAA